MRQFNIINYLLIVLFFIFGFNLNSLNADICDVCNCQLSSASSSSLSDIELNNESGNNALNIKCSDNLEINPKSIRIELGNIQWPSIDDVNGGFSTLYAFFNNLKYNYLPKILGSSMVSVINLDNNEIDRVTSDPFQQCKSLISLSIANNSLKELPKDFLKSTKQLRHLNLSRNFLSDIQLVTNLDKLITIDLSYNKLSVLSVEMLSAFSSVRHLNLEGNNIYTVQTSSADNDNTDNTNFLSKQISSNIIDLNLSKNNLTLITKTMFQYFQNSLERLNLGENLITNIEPDAFNKLSNLKILILQKNQLKIVSLNLPNSLTHLIINDNQLEKWPTQNIPIKLDAIQIQNNQLHELFELNDIGTVAGLIESNNQINITALNVSGNHIENFPKNLLFSELTTLDLSKNEFRNVPQNLAITAPKLYELILDENPIENIEFLDKLSLEILSMNRMPFLKELHFESFVLNVVPNNYRNCISLKISHCPNLTVIHPPVSGKLQLCELDLSYNQLYSIPENLTNWKLIKNGINLQGNPFICNCSSQWMLDILLDVLYDRQEFQHYLVDLKCNSPHIFAGHRFVKYLNWKSAFCSDISSAYIAGETIHVGSFGRNTNGGGGGDVIVDKTDEIQLRVESGPGAWIVIVLCSVTLICLILAGCYLTRLQREKMQRKTERIIYSYDDY